MDSAQLALPARPARGRGAGAAREPAFLVRAERLLSRGPKHCLFLRQRWTHVTDPPSPVWTPELQRGTERSARRLRLACLPQTFAEPGRQGTPSLSSRGCSVSRRLDLGRFCKDIPGPRQPRPYSVAFLPGVGVGREEA